MSERIHREKTSATPRPVAGRVLASLLASALVLTGCTDGGGSVGVSTTPDPAGIGSIRVYTRQRVADIGEIAVAVPTGFTDYHATAREPALSLVLPGPYFTELLDGRDVTQIDGDVMESVRVRNSPHTVEYRFRSSAVWSDGAPIGCADVQLRWLAATTLFTGADAEAMFGERLAGYRQIRTIDCADGGRTATVGYREPYADHRDLFDRLLPAHVLTRTLGLGDLTAVSGAPDKVAAAAEAYRTLWRGLDPATALSGGPYLITETSPGRTVLVRNPKWWGRPGGPARIVVRTADTATAVELLRARQVSAIEIEPDPAEAAALRTERSVVVSARAGRRFEHLDLNVDRPPLSTAPELRSALAICVNRQLLVDKLAKDRYPGAAPLGSVLLSPSEPGYTDHYADFNGSAGQARKLLENEGWALAPDGVYAKGGRRATLRVGYQPTPVRTQIVGLIRDSCARAGIEIGDAPAENFRSLAQPGGDWDTALLTGTISSTKSVVLGPSGSRGGTADVIADDTVTDSYRFANAELDPVKRVGELGAVDRTLATRLRTLPLYAVPTFVATDPDLTPVTHIPGHGGLLWNSFSWQKR
jgi:peptide/nickel transport system substrate-binding protein